jgi:DNA-binding MarR family transcriptional regulator
LGVVAVGDDFTGEYPDGDRLAAEAVATLIRAGQSIIAEIDRAMLASYGVPQPILTCLAVIEGAETALTPSEISERTLVSSATMTNTLDALERLGWARRIPNPEDRRSVLVEITDEGQSVADRFLPGIRVLEQAFCAELTSAERATLLKLLGKVLMGTAAVAASAPIPLEGRRIRPQRRPPTDTQERTR